MHQELTCVGTRFGILAREDVVEERVGIGARHGKRIDDRAIGAAVVVVTRHTSDRHDGFEPLDAETGRPNRKRADVGRPDHRRRPGRPGRLRVLAVGIECPALAVEPVNYGLDR